MRNCTLLLTIVFLLVWVPEGKTQDVWEVLSPTSFTRGTGEPVTETLSFSALGGSAIIKLKNGNLEDTSAERVSSSLITVNGQVIFGPSNFNQQADCLDP